MSFPFNAHQGPVIIRVEVTGPTGSVLLRLALDTGATTTLINAGPLVLLGYDPALAPTRMQITTGSGVEFVPRLSMEKVAALGRELVDFPVLCHTLPPSAGIDGVLGLDFFRGTVLTLDFQIGQITLS